MQYRLITLFKWTTAIAVVLAIATWFANYIYPVVSLSRDPPLLVWGRFFAVWAPIVGGAFLFCYWGIHGKRNDAWITYGLLAGVFAGIVLGTKTSLGEWTIDHFNPSLPYQDFRTTFGVIAGVIIGAWFGALFGGIASTIWKRHNSTSSSIPTPTPRP
jgi:hypothetical protein